MGDNEQPKRVTGDFEIGGYKLNGVVHITEVSLAPGDTVDVTAFKPIDMSDVANGLSYQWEPPKVEWRFTTISRGLLRWLDLTFSKVIWRKKRDE